MLSQLITKLELPGFFLKPLHALKMVSPDCLALRLRHLDYAMNTGAKQFALQASHSFLLENANENNPR